MPELVLVHGLGQDARAWDMVGIRGAYAHTLPGHGGRPPQRMSLPDMADELAADAPPGLLDVVGVALGGIVAQHLIVRHPGRVRSALLASTTARVGDRPALLVRADEAQRRGLGPLTSSLVDRWFSPAEIAAEVAGIGYVQAQLSAMPTAGYADMVRAMAEHDLVADLPRVTAPVTVLTGADDRVGPDSAGELARLLSHHRLRSAPGSHMLHLGNPAGFRAEIGSHLDWVGSGALVPPPARTG